MDRRAITSKENGKLGGRPKGSTNRPKIKDYMTEEQIKELAHLSWQKAMDGDASMMKFFMEQILGRAPQALEHSGEVGGVIAVPFDKSHFEYEEEKGQEG